MSNSTPIPWEIHVHHHRDGEYWATIGHNGRGPITDIIGEQGCRSGFYMPVAGMKHLCTPVETQKANAELIVCAVNSHAQLQSLAAVARSIMVDVPASVFITEPNDCDYTMISNHKLRAMGEKLAALKPEGVTPKALAALDSPEVGDE